MEYLEGDTLADKLAKGPLPLDQALRYSIEIADALDKAHRHGIVHRDLKTGNIMLTKSGAKLLDFGLAKTGASVVAGAGLSMLPTTPPNLTAQGTILGTFQYMAPEQLEGKEADSRTDIFAFGAVLYEMLTGGRAFDGKSHASLIAAILDHDPPPISSSQPLGPPALDRLVKVCLAKDPDERWQSASDLTRELKWVADAGATASSAFTMPGAVTRALHERPVWKVVAAASLIVALAAASAAVITWRRPAPELRLTRLDLVTPPTTEPYSFALSPDGRQIVFVAAEEGPSKRWLRPLDQTTAQPLAGTDGASAPFWSPDGRSVAFFAESKLKRIDLTGGAPQVLIDVQSVGRGGTWNRDGVIVFAGAGSGVLTQVPAAGGTATVLTRLARGQVGSRWPQFLPDGRRFLFFVNGLPDMQGVYQGSLDGGEPIRVMSAESAAMYAPPGYLLLQSQGVLVARRFDAARGVVTGDPLPVAQSVGITQNSFHGAFSISEAGVLAYRGGDANRQQLVWVDRAGKTLGIFSGPPEATSMTGPQLAPGGRQVTFSRNVQGNLDLWLLEVARGIASRFTFDPGTDSSPVWSPDGSRLIFRSSRNGPFDLFEKPANGSADEQPLLVTAQNKSPQSWSPDGQFLLYTAQDPKTQSDLWALPMAGGRKPFPVVQTGFDEIQGQFSPDGRWVAYASNETGRYEVYVRPFQGQGGKWQMSTGGGIYPRWRHDGKELFYMAPDNRLMALSIQVGPGAQTLSPGAPVALFASRLATGGIGITGFGSKAEYAVAPDGRFLLNVAVDDVTSSPITIVQNWTAGLTPVTGDR
ncbi:MAG: serine/threonine-protein kinase [Acidobacteria bacterium]|nr:serine/threonine-protein kinase [Acidobacteriota bacterium]